MRLTSIILGVIGLAFLALVVVQAPAQNRTMAHSSVMVIVGGGHGSGVYLGNGLVLTANHVVKGETSFAIGDDRGNKIDARLAWGNDEFDLAALLIDPSVNIAKSRLANRIPKIGESIEAIGNPLDMRDIHTWGKVASTVQKIGPWAQAFYADITIEHGSSGGPVFDTSGRVIGFSNGMPLKPVYALDGENIVAATGMGLTIIVPSYAACILMGC